MNQLYDAVGITKQAFHQYIDRQMRRLEEEQQLISVIDKVRRDHPRMGLWKLYQLLRPWSMGRDRFVDFCKRAGYELTLKRSAYKTTRSHGVAGFENLLAEKSLQDELTYVNQVWVSDITYYRIGETFYYITLILDLFSRRIVGWHVSHTLKVEDTTIPAFKHAIKYRAVGEGLIFHSDKGGQYYSKAFLDLTRPIGIHNSMGEPAYENAHAERVIKTIKHEYLIPYGPENFTELRRMLTKAVEKYNFERPHQSLYDNTPVAFEKFLTTV